MRNVITLKTQQMKTDNTRNYLQAMKSLTFAVHVELDEFTYTQTLSVH